MNVLSFLSTKGMNVISFLSTNCTGNWGKESTAKESVALFNQANSSIKIAAGRLDNQFYQDERVIESLKKAVAKGVSVSIAYFPIPANEQPLETIKEKLPEVDVKPAKQKFPRHWATIDGKHTRIECRHAAKAIDTPAIICHNASVLVEELDRKFEALV